MTPDLAPWQIALSGLALAVNSGISLVLSLGIARSLAVAALRMVLQLLLLAGILRWLFDGDHPALTFTTMLAMGLFAGYEVLARQRQTAGRVWTMALGSTVMLGAGLIVTLPALGMVIRGEPWFSPRLALPLFGMVAGSAMTGVALALSHLATGLTRDAPVIEARLAQGQTRWEAASLPLREAVRSGLMPTIASMSSTGLVTIPGMMTGQIIAGGEPLLAAKYQMLVMFLIAVASGLAVLVSTHAMVWRLTDARHRLRIERLSGG